MDGTTHTLFQRNPRKVLWYLVNCRAGSGSVDANSRCYIPYTTAGTGITAANNNYSVVMQNTTNSVIYSSTFDQGIGTLYWDCVNAFISSSAFYGDDSILLEVATNVTEAAAAEGLTLDGLATNQFETAAEWHAAKFDVLDVNNKNVTMLQTGITNFTPNNATAGSSHFFRVRAKMDWRFPVRFRIRRLSGNGDSDATGYNLDAMRLILIDNILVSYPPTTAELHHWGANTEAQSGPGVLGEVCSFTEPFLYKGEEGVKPQAYLSYLTNAMGLVSSVNLSNPVFHWRWRYLSHTNAWQSIALTQSDTQLVTTASIPLDNGVGDIDYYYTVNQLAPYYEPMDYAFTAGSGAGFGAGWTEGIFALTNRAYYSDTTSSGGNDFFARVRPGESPFESIELLLSSTAGEKTVVATNTMELVDAHLWRVSVPVATNMAGRTACASFALLNRQESGSRERAFNSEIWRAEADTVDKLPFPAVASKNSGGKCEITFDSVSTHLMFELNDETGAFTISHAAYQNFNLWTDATEGYMGNYVSTSGVAEAKTVFSEGFGEWTLSPSTNILWAENFKDDTWQNYTFGEFAQSITTPNGWSVSQGAIVSQDYTNINQLAVQVKGQGAGLIELSNLDTKAMPQGLGMVEFTARAAQSLAFSDFAYHMGGVEDSNYAFSGKLSFSASAGSTSGVNQYRTATMSPGTPSLSMVVYYHPNVGCYEYRIRRMATRLLEHSLYKWRKVGKSFKEEKRLARKYTLNNGGTPANWNSYNIPASERITVNFDNVVTPTGTSDDNKFGDYTACWVSAYNTSSGATHIECYLSSSRNRTKLESESASNQRQIISVDDSESPLTYGACAVLSKDCDGRFGDLRKHAMTGQSAFSKSVFTSLGPSLEKGWYFPSGRMTPFEQGSDMRTWSNGIKTLVPSTAVALQLLKTGDKNATWKTVDTKTVNSFFTNKYSFATHATDSYKVRVASGDGDEDARVDIVLDDLMLTQWRGHSGGVLGSDANNEAIQNSSAQYTNWVYTETWITNGPGASKWAHLQPRRCRSGYPQGLRSPYMGNGMAKISFNYTNLNQYARLLVQIATNSINEGNAIAYTSGNLRLSDTAWTTLTNFSFTAADNSFGTRTYSIGLRAPVKGFIRVITDPAVVEEAFATNSVGEYVHAIDYGQITVTSIYCADEPALDSRSWFGMNLHSRGWSGVPGEWAYLNDAPDGLSLFLNWSGLAADNNGGRDFADPSNTEEYKKNDPFVQAPAIESGIGNVSFKARKWGGEDQDVDSVVTLYGASSSHAETWTPITNFHITSSTIYDTHAWTTMDAGSTWKAVRLAVKGAKDGRGSDSAVVKPIQRVCIDEMLVSEPVVPKFLFRNAYPFRSKLRETEAIPAEVITSMDEQPLLGETFGIQVELEPQQMSDSIDLDSVEVVLEYYAGLRPWGHANWADSAAKVTAPLTRIGSSLVFRSTYESPASVIPPQEAVSGNSYAVVQYWLTIKYKDTDGVPHDQPITMNDWTMPAWLWPGDLNYINGGGLEERFSPFTILEGISPRRVWINEVNYSEGVQGMADENQFIELAVPAGADMKGWMLNIVTPAGTGAQSLDVGEGMACIATIGQGNATKTKKSDRVAEDRYDFYVIQSPKTSSKGTLGTKADATWDAVTGKYISSYFPGGTLNGDYSYGFELRRPSGVVEHQVIVEGANVFAGTQWEYMTSGTTLCQRVRAMYDNDRSDWFFAGADADYGTLGVWTNHGESVECWTNKMLKYTLNSKSNQGSPSDINILPDGVLQTIDPNWILDSNGTNAWIYASAVGGHIKLEFGGEPVEAGVIVIPQGESTNLVYTADPWYRVSAITTNKVAVPQSAIVKRADGKYEYAVENASGSINVIATNGPCEKLDGYFDPASPYCDALLAWLGQWDESSTIYLPRYRNVDGTEQGELKLMQAYWLDINPVQPGWIFHAGMGGGLDPEYQLPIEYAVVTNWIKVNGEWKPDVVSNVFVRIAMMITNDVSGDFYAPAVLQGRGVGETSTNGTFASAAWSAGRNPFLAITGALQEPPSPGDTVDKRKLYLPLRWFVLDSGSFDPATCSARIELVDPYRTGATYGWAPARDKYLIFYRWDIADGDSDIRPTQTTIEVLRKETYEDHFVPSGVTP